MGATILEAVQCQQTEEVSIHKTVMTHTGNISAASCCEKYMHDKPVVCLTPVTQGNLTGLCSGGLQQGKTQRGFHTQPAGILYYD